VVREKGGKWCAMVSLHGLQGRENSEHKSALEREPSQELGRDTVRIILEAKGKGLSTKSLKGSLNPG